MKGTDQFTIQKWAIFRKFRESAALRGGILLYTVQAIPPIYAEIAGKAHFWKETNLPHGTGAASAATAVCVVCIVHMETFPEREPALAFRRNPGMGGRKKIVV